MTNKKTECPAGNLRLLLAVDMFSGQRCVSTSDITVTTEAPTANAGTDVTICSGASTHLSASICTGCTYAWSPSLGLSATNISNPIATPASQTTYIVTVTDASGCTATDDITVSLDCCPAVFQELHPTYSTNTTLTGIWAMNNNVDVMSGTLTLQQITVMVSYNYKLTVHPGATLKLLRCNLYTCNNDMWQGIEVMAGGSIITSSTKIEDAMTAIHMLNAITTAANYTINGTTFNKNYKGMEIEHYNNVYTSTISNSTFDCVPSVLTPNGSIGLLNTLKIPYAGKRSNTGIEIKKIPNGITIGSTPGGNNVFRNIELGIHSSTAKTTVINCKFDQINYNFFSVPNTGICILADQGGKLIVGGTLPTQTNIFQNSANGIDAKDQIDADIEGNTFNNIAPVFSILPSRCINIKNSGTNTISILNNTFKNFSKTGVEVLNFNNSTINISNNAFKDFNTSSYGLGIYCVNNTSSILNIKNNSFTNTGNTPGKAAIRVQNLSLITNGPTTIESNNIEYCKLGIQAINISDKSGLLFIKTNNIKLKYITPPVSTDFGIQIQNCAQAQIYDNWIYKQGNNILSSSYDGLVIGVSIEANSMGSLISNNRTERLATGFRFMGINNPPKLNVTCNFMIYNRTGIDLALSTTNIGDQGFSVTQSPPNGIASNNQWAIPSSSGCWGVRSISLVTPPPTFYVKATSTPWFPSPGQMAPTNALLSGYVPNASYDCLYNCLTCIPENLVKLVKGQSPFDSLTIASKHISFRSVYKQIRENPELYQTGMPEDSVLINFADSIAITNIGKFYTVQEIYLSGDTLGAALLNSTITPENIMEENQKTVNEIYFNTWAQGNYWFTSQDSSILFDIANQSPMDGGIAVYDARVMLQYYKDDAYSGATAKVFQADTIQYDDYGFLYPNPATNSVFYSLELNEGEKATFMIYDILGNLEGKYNIKPDKNTIEIDLNNFASGVYLYQLIINDEYKTSGKLCVTK